jgi:hypothetical protein
MPVTISVLNSDYVKDIGARSNHKSGRLSKAGSREIASKESSEPTPKVYGFEKDSAKKGADNNALNQPVEKSVTILKNEKVAVPAAPSLRAQVHQLRQQKAAELKTNAVEASKSNESETEATDETKPTVYKAPLMRGVVETKDNPFSTFSLNISNVSFKLAMSALEKGIWPSPEQIRSEEFVNAIGYGDPAPLLGADLAFHYEIAHLGYGMAQDMIRFAVTTGAEGRSATQPLNLVVAIDASGSMSRIDRVAIIRGILEQMEPLLKKTDTVTVLTFNQETHFLGRYASELKAGHLAELVSSIEFTGGTRIEPGLAFAYDVARDTFIAGGINHVILLTDGVANISDEAAMNQLIESHRKLGIALDCFGIGAGNYNDSLLEKLSRNGDGRYAFINDPSAINDSFTTQLLGALHTKASDVKVQVEFNPDRVTQYRQIGFEQHQLKKEDFRNNAVDAAEMAQSETGNAVYYMTIDPKGRGDVGTFRIRYRVPGTQEYKEASWLIPYNPSVATLDQSTPALKAAFVAAEFAQLLIDPARARGYTLDDLIRLLHDAQQQLPNSAGIHSLVQMLLDAARLK